MRPYLNRPQTTWSFLTRHPDGSSSGIEVFFVPWERWSFCWGRRALSLGPIEITIYPRRIDRARGAA